MDEKSDATIAEPGRFTRFVYLLALLFVVFPVALKVFQGMRAVSAPSHVTFIGTSIFLTLQIGAVIFAALRAYWVLSGKTRLESPSGGTFATVARGIGIALMYVGVFGAAGIFIPMLIFSAPAIFAIFAYPLQAMIPFGLLLFESGRILAFEEMWRNRGMDANRAAMKGET